MLMLMLMLILMLIDMLKSTALIYSSVSSSSRYSGILMDMSSRYSGILMDMGSDMKSGMLIDMLMLRSEVLITSSTMIGMLIDILIDIGILIDMEKSTFTGSVITGEISSGTTGGISGVATVGFSGVVCGGAVRTVPFRFTFPSR